MKPRVNSVLNRSAQITNLCHPAKDPESTQRSLRDILDINKTYLGRYYYLFLLMESSGARITEILNIRSKDISKTGQIFVKGLKGSEDRVILDRQAAKWILKQKAKGIEVFETLNRFTAYRLLRNIGIGTVKKGRSKHAVTHIFRERFIGGLREIDIEESLRAKTVGHKNQKSTGYYGKD